MYYESYGIGGWLHWGALLAAGILSPIFCAQAMVIGRSLPTFLDLLGPREGRKWSKLTAVLGLTLAVTAVIAAQTALAFVFDPRYHDFPYASLTMAVVPFALLMLNRPQIGQRPIAESVFAGLLTLSAAYVLLQRGPRQLAVAVDLRDLSRCSRSRCGGRGPSKSKNEQADRKARQHDIVEHDAEAGGDRCRRSAARSTAASGSASRSPARRCRTPNS